MCILAFWFPFHKTDTESLHSPSLFPSLLSSPLFSLPLCSHSSPLFYIALLYSLFPSLSLSPSALSLSTPNVQESQQLLVQARAGRYIIFFPGSWSYVLWYTSTPPAPPRPPTPPTSPISLPIWRRKPPSHLQERGN